jgi:hypothetical protein
MEPVRIIIRGFVHKRRVFEDPVTLSTEEEMEAWLPKLAEKHAAALAAHTLHMIEIEFLDETDANDFGSVRLKGRGRAPPA